MTEYYERDGAVRVRESAGGHGGGATSVFDRPATAEETARYRLDHPVEPPAIPVEELPQDGAPLAEAGPGAE